MKSAVVESPVLTQIKSDAVVEVEAKSIQVGGSTEPAIKGQAFMDVFGEHQHSSSVGPTGPPLQTYGMKAMKTLSKKVMLG